MSDDRTNIDLESIKRLLEAEAWEAALTPEQRAEYERAQRSVVEARRAAEREGDRYVY